MMKLKYSFCIAFISVYGHVFSQAAFEKIKFQKIEVTNGLSNSNVTCSLQDSRGFLWVGTEDGLNKFNGYEFAIYRNVKGDTCSLVKNIINDLYEDSQGILWVSTRGGGVHYYDRKHNRFIRINAFSNDCEIVTITENKNSELLIGGTRLQHAFIATLNRKRSRWEYYDIFPSNMAVASIIPKSGNEYWIGVGGEGFYTWDKQHNTVQKYQVEALQRNGIISTDFVTAIKDDDVIWIATRKGLSKFDVQKETFVNFSSLSNNNGSMQVNNIRDLCRDGNMIWIATENGGLSRLNKTTNRFSNFHFDKDDPTSLSDNSVWSVYRDRQGRIWIGTFSKGLCIIDPLKNKFSELDIPLQNDVVNAIWRDQNKRIWIGTENGLVMKDGNTVHTFLNIADQKTSLSNNPVLSIFEDSKRQMWFGTWDGGVNKYIERTQMFTHYLPDKSNPNSLSNPNVYAIKESSSHELLVGTYGGLNVLIDEKAGKFEKYSDAENEANNYVRAVFEDRTQTLWMGSIAGLNAYDSSYGQRKRIYLNADAVRQDAFVNCITQDKKGRIWVGTNTALNLLVNKKFVASYTVSDGLPSDIVRSILEDNNGTLWLGTAQGLSHFNPETNSFTNYTVSDGLISNEFKPNACFKDQDGQLFFGGQGVIVFRPENVKANPFAPPVVITGLKLLNASVKIGGKDHVLSQAIDETKEIFIEPEYSFFTLEYVAMNFTSPDKNQYAFKLDGFHNEWNYVGGQRSATFTNLDPGTYIFHVKGSNNDGLWNGKGVSLTIHVLPPWWKTLWFKIIGVAGLMGAAIAYYQLRVHTIQKQKELLEIMVDDRTRELQHANNELSLSEEQIRAQNRELLLREEEIRAQNEELYNQREELTAANEELLRQGEELTVQNEELMQSEEEISAQRDLVSEQNKELQKARQIIEEQNDKIVQRNETLEAEVKERTKELIEYNQQLEQFAFISAHNLRAPVARILGLGKIFEYSKDNPDDQRLILEKLIFTTKELDRVVKDLNTILDLRKDNDTLISDIDLESELKLLKVNLEKEIEDTGTQITCDFQVQMVHTVKPYLDSILINLISNAIKYRHPDRVPSIHIRSEIAGDYVCISVADNGLGIDTALFKDKLFKLYNRFHTHLEGKGMGLFLVKTQVLALGGRIEVESNVNDGSNFKVYLKIKYDRNMIS